MVSVEVGNRVITLVPVHIDHHSVERADTRYAPRLFRSSGLDWPDRLEPDPRAAAVVDLPEAPAVAVVVHTRVVVADHCARSACGGLERSALQRPIDDLHTKGREVQRPGSMA